MGFSDLSPDNTLIGGTDGATIGNTGSSLHTFITNTVNTQLPAAQTDAFGRVRVSEPISIFESTFEFDLAPLRYTTLTASDGSITHDNDKKAAVLACTTTTNSSATMQSRQYLKYHPGKSQLVLMTGNFKSAATNVKKQFGQYDNNNGYFFQLSSSTLSVALRSKISGSVVDTVVDQTNWNIDKLDGTGASGYTLDLSKQQIMFIAYQWLGAGTAYFGFSIEGKLIVCHAMHHSNYLTTLYSQTANLPIRAHIINSSATASTLEYTCCAVISEGGWGPQGILRSVNYGTSAGKTFSSAGSRIPILSLRKQSAYVQLPITIEDVGVFINSADDFLIEVVINPTLTSASWSNVDGYAQKDVAATAATGGTTIYSSYIRGSSTGASVLIADIFRTVLNAALGCDLSGASDIVSIVGTNITATANASAFLNYKELV